MRDKLIECETQRLIRFRNVCINNCTLILWDGSANCLKAIKELNSRISTISSSVVSFNCFKRETKLYVGDYFLMSCITQDLKRSRIYFKLNRSAVDTIREIGFNNLERIACVYWDGSPLAFNAIKKLNSYITKSISDTDVLFFPTLDTSVQLNLGEIFCRRLVNYKFTGNLRKNCFKLDLGAYEAMTGYKIVLEGERL